MELTRRQLFAGLLVAPLVPRKLLVAPAASLPEILPRKYESNRFYWMGADFMTPFNVALVMKGEFSPAVPLELYLCADALHRKVMEAAEGRRVIWHAPMELRGFIDGEWNGSVGPIPLCRYLRVWDCLEDRWIHRLDVEVAFEDWKDFGSDRLKIGETLYVRRPIRWLANQPGKQSSL